MGSTFILYFVFLGICAWFVKIDAEYLKTLIGNGMNTRSKVGLFLLFAMIACNDPSKKEVEIKIAKTVPSIYVNAVDSLVQNHEDTIYQGGKYFSGYIYSLYPAKDTEYLYSYFNGVEEGQQKKWYPNKQLSDRRFYINGKKEGLQEGWWENGGKRFVYTANSDTYIGEDKEWTITGLLFKDFHYVDGQEEGSQKMWWPDGNIRANYVVRNGKKYGFLGNKVCVNPYDSISKK